MLAISDHSLDTWIRRGDFCFCACAPGVVHPDATFASVNRGAVVQENRASIS